MLENQYWMDITVCSCFFYFQKKLRDLQKWHNELEFKLFKCRDYKTNGNGSLSSCTNTSSDIERNEP